MRPLIIGFVVLTAVAISDMANIDSLENDKYVRKRILRSLPGDQDDEQEDDSQESFRSLIEEKLMHQSQALEHLIKVAGQNKDMIKKLIENLSKGLEKPKLPTKAEPAEVLQINRNNKDNSKDNPVVKLGKNIPKYGKLAKDLMFRDNSNTDPTPLIEEKLPLLQPGSRRSLGEDPVISPNKDSDDDVNPWCPLALLCEKTDEPICGFDDQFGYGKFENFCHLLRVNCYWKYNFAMVVSCRPKL